MFWILIRSAGFNKSNTDDDDAAAADDNDDAVAGIEVFPLSMIALDCTASTDFTLLFTK